MECKNQMSILPDYFLEDLESYYEFSMPFRAAFRKENGRYAHSEEVLSAWKKTENQRLKARIRKLTNKLEQKK